MRNARLLSSVSAFLVATEAHALTVRPTTLESTLAESDVIVEAIVQSVRNEEESETDVAPMPKTVYRLAVVDELRGSVTSGLVEVAMPGGFMSDGTGVLVPGVPQIPVGARVMLSGLLIDGREDRLRLHDMSAGLLYEACDAADACVVKAGVVGDVTGLSLESSPAPGTSSFTFDDAKSTIEESMLTLSGEAVAGLTIAGAQ